MAEALTKIDLESTESASDELHVLDLPQLYTKPSAAALLETLDLLDSEPHSWDITPSRTPKHGTPRTGSGANTPRRDRRKVKPDGVPQYLTNIISSRLAWIEQEEEREKIWDNAAIRLSGRSGRTARGGFSRTFTVPTRPSGERTKTGQCHGTVENRSSPEDPIEIMLYEPGLTADNLGHKTWAASYVLAQNWSELYEHIPVLASCRADRPGGATILELGAGTGLVGIAAAIVLGARVVLTDLPEIVQNLTRNVDSNSDAIAVGGGITLVATLDWSRPLIIHTDRGDTIHEATLLQHHLNTEDGNKHSGVAVIVAADPIYSMSHPALLVNAIKAQLSHDRDSVVIIALPLRDAYQEERTSLCQQLQAVGLKIIFEKHDIGYDDWTQGRSDEPIEVDCDVSVWTWQDDTSP